MSILFSYVTSQYTSVLYDYPIHKNFRCDNFSSLYVYIYIYN